MEVIYEPRGKAREYSELACNVYAGCEHGCQYCYCPAIRRQTLDVFSAKAEPRKDILRKIDSDARKMAHDTREILLSFMCDPYQPVESHYGVTREALRIFAKWDLRVQVLTKGGTLACRDFDLLRNNGWKFGTTLLFSEQASADEWEPGAAKLADRVTAIRAAHDAGIYTWVSVEPVIEPAQALEVIGSLIDVVDFWKVGKLNHNREVEAGVDWAKFLRDAQSLLGDRPHYIKKDLLRAGEL